MNNVIHPQHVSIRPDVQEGLVRGETELAQLVAEAYRTGQPVCVWGMTVYPGSKPPSEHRA